MPLGNILREGTGLPVALINDANAAAVGEVWMGGEGSVTGNSIFVTLGTGVGGGIIIDSKIMQVITVPVERLDMHVSITMKFAHVTAVITDVWSSMHLQPELYVWQMTFWRRARRTARCVM